MEREKLIRLVTSVQRGEKDAATELYDSFFDDIYYHLLKSAKDPDLAADLTQDTFIEILETIDKLEEPAAFVTWSKQIAYHKWTAHCRKRREFLADESEDGYSVFDNLEEDREEFIPDEALDREELKNTIRAMVDSLPEEQRSAIIFRYFDEISVKQIADIQGVSEGTVKSRLNYGRKAIKQSVEDYEKKNDIKLHCAGVVPLLLWLGYGAKAAGGSAAVVSTVSATASAASTVASVVDAGAKVGAKVTKHLAAKIVAGVTAATVVTGGVTAGVLLTREPEETQPPKVVEASMEWVGYGEMFYSYEDRRFEITVEQMDDSHIEGHLQVSYLYSSQHDTDFTGEGTRSADTVTYTLTFDTPYVESIGNYEFAQITMQYDEKTQQFTMDDYYDVTMERQGLEEDKVLERDEVWSGVGEDSLCNSWEPDHQFRWEVYKMTESEISGEITLSKDGQTEHISEFTGRGFKKNGSILYEIKLETPRSVEFFTTLTVDCFWVTYDPGTDSFEIPDSYFYSAVMNREK